jgi:trigger factor
LWAKGGDAITFDLQAAFGNGGLFRRERPERKRKPRPTGDYVFSVEKVNRTTARNEPRAVRQSIRSKAVASREEFDAKVRETIQWNYDRERGNASQQHRWSSS